MRMEKRERESFASPAAICRRPVRNLAAARPHSHCFVLSLRSHTAQVLRVVLASGNLLNAGTHRGSAESIKLDVLLKLADVKVTAAPPSQQAAAAAAAAAVVADGTAQGAAAQQQQQQAVAANGGLPADQPAHVKTLLDFVAWVVLREALREAASAKVARSGGSSSSGSSSLSRTARAGYLQEELSSLGDAVRRMQTGGCCWGGRAWLRGCLPALPAGLVVQHMPGTWWVLLGCELAVAPRQGPGKG